jgi:tripartite-type tricarboxylate transporter receptor subunit TctC
MPVSALNDRGRPKRSFSKSYCGKSMESRLAAGVLLIGAMTLATGAGGQDYPNKPIRIITSGAGSVGDVNARLVANGMGSGLGAAIIVDNRTSGIIPAEAVARAAPDGYTLLVFGSVVWLASFMQDHVPFEPFRDFAPVTWVSYAPNILVVHPSLPVKSVKELIALAKAKPGTMNYGSSGPGSSSHLAGEAFKSMAGVNIVRINYKNLGLAFNDVITGQIQFMFATAGSVTSQVKAGKMRALAVTSAQPSALFPGVVTVAASGLPGFESGSRTCMFAPAKTPDAIVRRLNQEAVRFLQSPDAKEKFLNVSLEVIGSSPERLVAEMKSEMTRMGKVIRDAGIRSE